MLSAQVPGSRLTFWRERQVRGTSEKDAGDDVLPFDGQQPLKAGM